MSGKVCWCNDETCIQNRDGLVCTGSPELEVRTFTTVGSGEITVVICTEHIGREMEDHVPDL